jgi:pimeloyl-ACP methyl ester carboxylesterase
MLMVQLWDPLVQYLADSALGRALLFAPFVARPSQLGRDQVVADVRAARRAAPLVDLLLRAHRPFRTAIPRHIPVTIAWGNRDFLLLPYQATVARSRLPHAVHVPLPGCGHVPMSDDPLLVANVLLEATAGDGAAG